MSSFKQECLNQKQVWNKSNTHQHQLEFLLLLDSLVLVTLMIFVWIFLNIENLIFLIFPRTADGVLLYQGQQPLPPPGIIIPHRGTGPCRELYMLTGVGGQESL
jgi:hypothetical protein